MYAAHNIWLNTMGRYTCRPCEGRKLLITRSILKKFGGVISLLPQEPFLMKRSVFKNVSYGLKLRDHKDDTAGMVNEALSLVGLSSEEFAQRPWYALSGGEAQCVAFGLSQTQFQEQSLFPGKSISITYSIDRVKWI